MTKYHNLFFLISLSIAGFQFSSQKIYAQTAGSETPSATSTSAPSSTAPATSPDTSTGGSDSQNQIYLKVGGAAVRKSLLAFPAFQSQNVPGQSSKLGKEIKDVVANDLSVSDYFEFIKPSAFLEDVSKVGPKPITSDPNGFKFDTWKQLQADFLIRGGFRHSGNEVTLDAYLYNVSTQKSVLAKSYKASENEVRVLAHTFANDVIQAISGKPGIFLSRLICSRALQMGKKEIFVMDWDGYNEKPVTNHRSISISPAWAPDGKSIVYTTFAYHENSRKRNADLFQYDFTTGKRFAISYKPGINSGAHFYPDGKAVVLTLSQGGNPDIFKLTLDGGDLKRLTDGPRGALNVEPSVSPDGKTIAFSSDRSGKAMLYQMDSSGGNIKRITYAGDLNSSPTFSPDGKKMAFAGYDGGHFDIFVMDSDGTNIVRITSARKPNGKASNNESPSFSPDGRLLLYSSDRSGSSQLYISTLDGSSERRITFNKGTYEKPQWSPRFD